MDKTPNQQKASNPLKAAGVLKGAIISMMLGTATRFGCLGTPNFCDKGAR